MTAEEFNMLLRQIDEGDEGALLTLQRTYGKLIKYVASKILNNKKMLTTILNDVMLKLWNNSKDFQNINKPIGCIIDLAKKASYDYYRTYLKKK